ncbi:MAG: HAD hydrolase family protein [Hamadaea sp.]|nr:HAD hydrolase family protein [Hamadaea sp.]NUT02378.1 HAD hydrolase family protein [Hamadaea sp.]
MATLYVTDLDGTLLTPESAVSPTSVKIINELIGQGLQFTVATARSPYTALPILSELDLRLPMAFINGVFIYDPVSGTELARNLIRPATAVTAVDVLLRHGLRPLVFTIDADGHHRIHHLGGQNASEQHFVAVRLARGDQRFKLVTEFEQALSEEILTVIAIDTPDRIDPVLAELPEDLYAHLGPDRGVPGYAWLELCHPLANKADAVRFIRDHVAATRLVCFGDNANDLPMFAIADESYAVANATEAALAAAGGTVGPNDADGVARHLQGLFEAAEADLA